MEKVVLTKGQVNSMKAFLDDNGNDKEHLVDWFVANRDFRYSVDIEYRGLADLKTSTLSKALYTGYEIEPEKPKFKPGDKIVNDDKTPIQGNKLIATYDGQNYIGLHFLKDIAGGFIGRNFRLATPEEIKWYEKLGRKFIGDFHYGDVAVGLDEHLYLVGMGEISIQEAKDMYNHGLFKGIYPIGSYSRLPKEESK